MIKISLEKGRQWSQCRTKNSFRQPHREPFARSGCHLPQEGGLGDFTHKMTYYAVGVCDLKFNITNIELGCRHCRPSALFLKIALKLFVRKVFGATFFQKGSKNSCHKLTTRPTSLFLLAQKGAKEKALQKENAVFMGRCPKPHSFFEKNETKNF